MPRLFKRGGIYYCWGWLADGARWKESTRQRDRKAAEVVQRVIERRRASQADPSAHVGLFEALKMLEAADTRAQRSQAVHEIRTYKGRHLIRLLGRDFNLAGITPDETAAYADARLEEGASPHSVHKEIGTLRRAMRCSRLTWHAALMPDLGTVYQPRERWLTEAEYRTLIAALPAERADYVTAWCYLGARRSELYGLTAADVDLERKQARLRGKKTRGADRWVPIHPVLLPVLRRRLKRGDPLFAPWTNALRDLELTCTNVKIEPVTPNDLRRTFCSWLANAEVSPLVAAKLMGHTSTRMVETVYARLGVDIQRDAVSRLPGRKVGTHLARKQRTGRTPRKQRTRK